MRPDTLRGPFVVDNNYDSNFDSVFELHMPRVGPGFIKIGRAPFPGHRS